MKAKFVLFFLLTLLVVNLSSCFLKRDKKYKDIKQPVQHSLGKHFNDKRGIYPDMGRTPEQMAMKKRKMRKIARKPELAGSIKLVTSLGVTRETRKFKKAEHYKLMKKGEQAVLPDHNYQFQLGKNDEPNQLSQKDTTSVIHQDSKKDTTGAVNQTSQKDTTSQKSYFDMPEQKDTTGQKIQTGQPDQNSPDNGQGTVDPNTQPGQGQQDKMNSGGQQNKSSHKGKKSKKSNKKKKTQ